jgi:sialate O-acetylesterase
MIDAMIEDDYGIVYKLDIPDKPNFAKLTNSDIYEIDNSDDIGAFTRIVYFLHLESVKFGSQCVWVSMDAFTDNVQKIGVPTYQSNAVFQEEVYNMNVVSNVLNTTEPGTAGNIEFWPNTYGIGNDSVFDHSDTRNSAKYGSMQVHVKSKTVFAFNHWNAAVPTEASDLGIGTNHDSEHTDWTWMYNGGSYTVKTLEVWVK